MKRLGNRRVRLTYRLLVTLGAFLLLCWTVAVTISVSFQEMLPSISAKVGIADGRALGNLAEQTVATGSLSDAARIARAAVQKDPTVVDAIRILGFAAIEEGDGDTANALFSHADRLSRRDVGSQLWLFQHYGKRGDGQRALRHLDAAMASDIEIRNQLLPLLVVGLTDPQIVKPLTDTLSRRPEWGTAFLNAAATTATSLENVDRLFRLVHARGVVIEPAAWGSLINRQVEAGRYAEASRHYLHVSGRRLDGGINDGRFEHPGLGTPFDWNYGSSDDHEAVQVRVAGRSGMVLAFSHGDAPPQVLLRQLLLLPSGRYQLTGAGLSGRIDRAEAPTWSLVCADAREAIGRTSAIATRSQWNSFALTFEVPALKCRAQWLELKSGSVKIDGRASGYFDELELQAI